MLRILAGPVFFALCVAVSLGETLLIPYTAFPDTRHAVKVKEVVDHYTFHRKLNENRFMTTDEVLDYLLDNMPLTATIMRHLGLEEYVISVGDDGMMVYDDKAGMTGTFEPVYVTRAKRIFYGDGFFDTGILGKIRGESVLVMVYRKEEPDIVCNTVTVFIRVHGLLGPLCKVASPILNGMVGRKSATLLNASIVLSEELASDPESVYERISECEEITSEELGDFRNTFLTVVECP